jgi:hypothetical protein
MFYVTLSRMGKLFEVLEFVWEHEQECESRPVMDYGLDVNPM